MADSSTRKKGSVGKIIGIVLGILLLLLVAAYFVVTSSAFLKSVIVPKASQALHADVEIGEIDLSPFSSVTVKNLKVRTTGTEPLLVADEVRARYSLMDIIKGHINVSEVTLVKPVINIVQETNGTSNLDPITQGDKKPADPASKTPDLNIRNLTLRDGVVKQIQNTKEGRKVTELTGLNLTVDRVQNGQPGKLTVNGQMRIENNAVASAGNPGTNEVLVGKLDGNFDFAIDSALKPQSIKGTARVDVSQASGGYAQANGLTSRIDCDLTPTELKQLALRFEKAGKALGQLDVSGPFDIAKTEGKLTVRVSAIDREVLNLVGAGHHWDFGSTTLNSSNTITLSQQGKAVAVNGILVGNNFSLTENGATTPTLNLQAGYDFDSDLNGKSAVVRKLDISARQQNRDLIKSSLDKPMNLSWGNTAATVPDSAFNLAVTQLDMAQWKSLLGTNAPLGVANVNLKLTAQNNGKALKTEVTASIANLDVAFGSNRLSNAELRLETSGSVQNMNLVDLPQLQFSLKKAGANLVEGQGSARYNLSNKTTMAKLTISASPARLLEVNPVADVSVKEGALKADLQYDDNGTAKKAAGNLQLDKFTGGYAAYQFRDFGLKADFDVALQGQDCQINKLVLAFQQSGNPAGTLEASGRYNLQTKQSDVQFKTAGLNERTLEPILASSLGENRLVSIALDASGSAKLDDKGENAIKADLNLANWVVENKASKVRTSPLTVRANADVGLKGSVTEIRNVSLKLAPTPRANNQLQIKGRVDTGKTNASPSTITIQSDGLDVTPYYDMFAGGTNKAEEAKSASTKGNEEPKPITLPFEQFTADLKIDKFYLREIAISNWVGTAKINKGEITLKPFSMVVNGGPLDVNGVVNVSVPGYRYDLGLKADLIPLEPFANSFSTNKKGQMTGQLLGGGIIKGAGTTGANLKKNLTGNLDLSLTNLNFQIVGQKTRNILQPIALILRVPELLDSPLTLVDLKTEIGAGNINLSRMFVNSPAFQADVKGVIPINDVLTNSSLNLPVSFALRRSLAQKAGLLSAETPTNAAYASLPSFVKLGGTIGDPKSDIDKLVISGLVLRSVGGIIPGLGDKANIIQGVGGILSGQKSVPTTSSTNAPSTNAPSKAETVLRGLSGILGGNHPATNAVKQTNDPAKPNPIGDLFKLLPKK